MLKIFKNLSIRNFPITTNVIQKNDFSSSLGTSTSQTSTDVCSNTNELLENNNKMNENNQLKLIDEKDKLYSRLEIELKGIDRAVLNSYSWFATTAANHLGIEVGKCWALRRPYHDRMTLLKSVHIYKKHRVQYEIRTYYRYMNLHKLTGSTLDTYLEYIERNLPEGVALKATKIEIQDLPEHLKIPPTINN